MDISEKRFSDIELAIKELTILNKNQEMNANRQADAIDKILEHLQGMAVLEHVVDGNIEDITKIGLKIEDIYTKMASKEGAMQKEVTNNREELKALGSERLIKSVTYSAIISAFLFGYLYLDFHQATVDLKDFNGDLRTNSAKIFHLEEVIKDYKNKHDKNDIKMERLLKFAHPLVDHNN